MSKLYKKSIHKLELNIVLEKLASCADSHVAKEACRNLEPVSDLDSVRHLLEQTNAALQLCLTNGNPNFSDTKDVSESLERADLGGCLQPKELLTIAALLRCVRNVKNYITNDNKETVLDSLYSSLTPNKYLEDKIFGAILSEDEIADNATPELADIRRHMRIQGAKIKDSLQKMISSPAYSKYLREPIITIRQGRYVVPVKSECKNEIPGLVHDVSATGSTVFVEPMSAVNANNELRELELKEKKEIERILAEFSAEVAAHRETITDNYIILVSLDVIFAKAKLAMRMKACAPVMNEKGSVNLINARHPLIDPKKVVPVSVHLGDKFDTMIITGPNTGGKTVTVKTIGLLTLMAECGLYIPADDGSSLSTFECILADIGDEQSIAQSLSTFSSHMRTIVDIIAQCDNRCLVLFDEQGAGTDPAEGSALAIALIEYCRKQGSYVVATTHYAELKLYAMRTNGVINASCEFNVETLQPTYKLLIGIPGKSNAFAISRKLGLSERIIDQAANYLDKSDKDFEDALNELEMQRQKMEIARREAEKLQQETQKIKHQTAEYNIKLQEEREKALQSARQEAQAIIEDARRTANAAYDELKALKKQLSENGDLHQLNQRQSQLRKNLNESEERIRSGQKQIERPAPSRAIIIGDTVELIKLGTKASVLAINKDGTYQLQAGILKLNAKPDEIYLLEHANTATVKSSRPAHSGRQMNTAAMPAELDLRGMDSIEAVSTLELYLDEAMRSKVPSVRIIHGKGTGVLRSAVQQSLRKNKYIKAFRLGVYGEGEDGVTIAEFKKYREFL